MAEGRKDWPGTLAHAEYILTLPGVGEDKSATASAWRFAAAACCAMDRPEEMELWIERLTASAPEEGRARRRFYVHRMVCRRAGKPYPVGKPPA